MDLFSGAGRKKEGRAGLSSNQGHIPLFRPHRATLAPPSLFEPLYGLTAFWCETSTKARLELSPQPKVALAVP